MSAWKAKRFWTEARAEACDGGFTVRLDGRPVKTPAKVPLVVPTLEMAQAIAAEWDAQTGDYTLASVDGREQTFVLVMHT
jgi:chaperone required for assembly of F1-ATPase